MGLITDFFVSTAGFYRWAGEKFKSFTSSASCCSLISDKKTIGILAVPRLSTRKTRPRMDRQIHSGLPATLDTLYISAMVAPVLILYGSCRVSILKRLFLI